jgi:hypothetical protein
LTKKPEGWNELWDSFDRYYIENEKAIMEAAQLDMTELGQGSSKKAIRYDAAMTSFLENSKMILHGLQFLSEIHPAISGMSSKYVVSLLEVDLTTSLKLLSGLSPLSSRLNSFGGITTRKRWV